MLARAGTRPPAPYPPDRRCTALFDAQAARTPDAVAVVCGGAAADLRRAERAGEPAGAPPARAGRRAGRAGRRSAWSASPIWSSACSAILKAGGAYVPLDPTYPRERLAFMLADARRRCCHPAPLARRPAGRGRRRIVLPGRATRRPGAAQPPSDPAPPSDARRTWPTSSTPPARPAAQGRAGDAPRRWSTSCWRCADDARASAPTASLLAVTSLSLRHRRRWSLSAAAAERRRGCWSCRATLAVDRRALADLLGRVAGDDAAGDAGHLAALCSASRAARPRRRHASLLRRRGAAADLAERALRGAAVPSV